MDKLNSKLLGKSLTLLKEEKTVFTNVSGQLASCTFSYLKTDLRPLIKIMYCLI